MEDIMILTKDNEPIYKMSDSLGGYHINNYMVRPYDTMGQYTIAEVEAYLAEHPEALVPEPVPPPPSAEELLAREEQGLLAYLASTDWYGIRFAETGVAIPADVVGQRLIARARISEIRITLAKLNK